VNKWEKTRMIGGWVQAVVELITQSIMAARERRRERREQRIIRKKNKRMMKKDPDTTAEVWRPAHESSDKSSLDYKSF
jgi:hypothetical protein